MIKESENAMGAWWQQPSLVATQAELRLDGLPLTTLAAQHGTPLYLYSRATIQRQIGLAGAFERKPTVSPAIFKGKKLNEAKLFLSLIA